MTRSTVPIPDVPGMDYAHPLYVIPTEYWDSLPDDIRCSIVAMYGDGLVRVYAAPAHLATTVMQSDIDPDDYATGDQFRTVYTPTEEEICRGLRGPVGPVGAMGPMGNPGHPGDQDLTRRIDAIERLTNATMKAITTIVTTLVNSGVIDADTILKENQ